MIQRVLAVNRNNNNTTSASCVHLSDVGGNEVTDKLFHVVVDGTTLFNGGDNGGEVIISQNHLRNRLGDTKFTGSASAIILSPTIETKHKTLSTYQISKHKYTSKYTGDFYI